MIGIDVKDQQVLLAEIRHFGRLVAGVVNLDGGDFLLAGPAASQRTDADKANAKITAQTTFNCFMNYTFKPDKLPTKAVKRNFSVGS